MYNCEVCGVTSGPGDKRRVHRLYRHVPREQGEGTRQEIAQEVQVCGLCELALNAMRQGAAAVRQQSRQATVANHSNGKPHSGKPAKQAR